MHVFHHYLCTIIFLISYKAGGQLHFSGPVSEGWPASQQVRSLGAAVVDHLEPRALDAVDLPVRGPDRALGAPVRPPQDRKEGEHEAHHPNDDLKPARELHGHRSVRVPSKKPARTERAREAFGLRRRRSARAVLGARETLVRRGINWSD